MCFRTNITFTLGKFNITAKLTDKMFSRVSRVLTKARSLTSTLETPDNSVFLRQVRWRKRRWTPMAITKMYLTPKQRRLTYDDPELTQEHRTNCNHYSTTMRSIRKYLKDRYVATDKSLDEKATLEEERKLYLTMMELNDKWNQTTGDIREARQLEEQQEFEEQQLQSILQREEMDAEIKSEAEKSVLEAQELVKDFINVKNLEDEIENALNLRHNYNFAIDLEGNRYHELPDGTTSIESQDGEEAEAQGSS